MAEGKRKFIADAASVAWRRARALEDEIRRTEEAGHQVYPADRACVHEAYHIADLIWRLAYAPYHRDPYTVATERWMRGEGSAVAAMEKKG